MQAKSDQSHKCVLAQTQTPLQTRAKDKRDFQADRSILSNGFQRRGVLSLQLVVNFDCETCRLQNWQQKFLSRTYLEGKLADEQLSALLVLPDLTKSHGTWPVPATSIGQKSA